MLAAATFASVRSANRASRTAERALLAGLRPVLVPSRFQDPPEKVGFMDEHWVKVEGGRAVAEVVDGVVYLAIALRNVGSGIAVLDRWDFFPQRALNDVPHRDPEEYRRLTRDLYVPAGDLGFWQGAFRDIEDPIFDEAAAAIKERQPGHRRPVLRRSRGRPAHHQPLRADPSRRRRVDHRCLAPLEHRARRPPLSGPGMLGAMRFDLMIGATTWAAHGGAGARRRGAPASPGCCSPNRRRHRGCRSRHGGERGADRSSS